MWPAETLKLYWPEPKSLTGKPQWFPFPSRVAFKSYEAEVMYSITFGSNVSGLSDFDRVRLSSQGCNVTAIRSCSECEGEYLKLIRRFNTQVFHKITTYIFFSRNMINIDSFEQLKGNR